MSYHRKLPPPLALVQYDCASKSIPQQDTLLQYMIMADRDTRISEDRVRKSSQLTDPISPAPTDGTSPSQASDASVEDLITSPKTRARSSVSSHRSSNALDQRLSSVTQDHTKWNTPSSICLCQPDPKVPRPRNAFILYRQHHQAHVVHQNPGLANPEISKVIGDHWRQSPPEVKAHWKNLAEEEKIRHARQYPDYRYQPRRNGRNTSVSQGSNPSGSPMDAENRRCAKCGGRSINTPSIVSSAGYLASASTISPGTPYSANRPPSTPSTASSAKRFLQSAGSPPMAGPANSFLHHRNRDISSNISALGLATPRFRRTEENENPLSPDPKRRRVVGPLYPTPRMANGPSTPFAFPQRRESLPRPDFMNSPTFAMGPPPRPYPVAPPPDSSLTLPPLQHSPVSTNSSQAKSVEAMVMSIPPLNKIRILSKISPPLANPSPASPAFATKGLIVAIDGQDFAVVEQITAFLNTVLTSSYAVKVFQSPIAAEELRESASSTVSDSTTTTASIETCHLNMAKYLALSAELKTYITSVPAAAVTIPSPAVSPKSILPPSSSFIPIPETQSSSSATTGIPSIPIALIPAYQLTHTDFSACRVPIDDNYAPTDHWQWMASMWRGIVGPDITIAVKMFEDEQQQMGGRNGRKGGGGGEAPEVDVRLEDSRAVVLRVERGGKIGEGALRRVGFEVGEWIRGKVGG
ncbi:MAG: hypothetical protein Q9220_005077 [cf. Caloplaca sp. 1 TL-2023]